jgi:hypothetical protein
MRLSDSGCAGPVSIHVDHSIDVHKPQYGFGMCVGRLSHLKLFTVAAVAGLQVIQ